MGRVFQIWLAASLDPINGTPFTVPANATNINCYAGGAGGCGSDRNIVPVGGGGGGGGATAKMLNANIAGQTVRIIVGRGGSSEDNRNGERSAITGVVVGAGGTGGGGTGAGAGNVTGGAGGTEAASEAIGGTIYPGLDGGNAT